MSRIHLILSLALCAASSLAATPITPSSYVITGSPYGYVDDSGKQLTDGIYNSMIPGVSLASDSPPNPYPAYDWVGWHGNSPSIDFDFGAVVTIQSVTVSFALWTPAGVYLPAQAVVNSTLFNIAADGMGNYSNMDRVKLTFDGNWTGSNLTLNLNQAQFAWMFVDEVLFETAATTQPPTNAVPEGAATSVYVVVAVGLLGLARRMFPRAKA